MRIRVSGCSLLRARRLLRLLDALQYRPAGDRAIGADIVGIALRHLPEHRPADLHRCLVELGLHPPGSVVAAAALDRGHRRLRHPFQHFAGLLPDVLHSRVTGNVIADFAEPGLELPLEQPVLVAQHQILERVEHRRGNRFGVGVPGKQQRQLTLEHQCARRHGSQNRIAVTREVASFGMLDVLSFSTASKSPSSSLGMPQQASFSTSAYGISLCSSIAIRSSPIPGSL